MKKYLNGTIEKSLSILGFVAIIIALFLINIFPAATGYEFSIFNAYPTYFWGLFIFAYFCGFIIMIRQALINEKSKLWLLGFLLIIFTNIVFLLIPLLRGYTFFGTGDSLTHVGYVKDIILNGHFGVIGKYENFYPISHILIYYLNYITGFSVEKLISIMPIFFIVFYMVSIYLLSTVITSNRGKIIFITALGSLLLFRHENYMFAPSIIAFFLLPYLLYLYYKSNADPWNSKFALLFIFMILVMPLIHPGEGTLYLIPIFIVIFLALFLYKTINKYHKKPLAGNFLNNNLFSSFSIVLLILVSWFTWMSSFYVLFEKIQTIKYWFVYGIGSTDKTAIFNVLEKANLTLNQIIEYSIKMYGQYFLFFGLTAILCLMIWKKFLSKEGKVKIEEFTLSILFLVFGILMIMSFTNDIGVGAFRGMRYLFFVSTILIGMYSYNLSKRYKYKFGSLMVFFLVITATICMFNTFPSTSIKELNPQVTVNDMAGTQWILMNCNSSSYFSSSMDPNYIPRLADSIVGKEKSSAKKFHFVHPPDHFNYTETKSYGSNYPSDSYYIDWTSERFIYPVVFPDYKSQWKFTEHDYNYLENIDPSVNAVYSNGEFWIYFVKNNL